jgi:hypothetical protein
VVAIAALMLPASSAFPVMHSGFLSSMQHRCRLPPTFMPSSGSFLPTKDRGAHSFTPVHVNPTAHPCTLGFMQNTCIPRGVFVYEEYVWGHKEHAWKACACDAVHNTCDDVSVHPKMCVCKDVASDHQIMLMCACTRNHVSSRCSSVQYTE